MYVSNGAQAELNRAIQKAMREENLRFSDALSKVGRERPDLYERARQEVMSGDETEILSGVGSSGKFAEPNHPAQRRLVRLTEERMRAKRQQFHEAFSEICREYRELAEEARQESLKDRL